MLHRPKQKSKHCLTVTRQNTAEGWRNKLLWSALPKFFQNHPHQQREATPKAECSLKQGKETVKDQKKQDTLPEMLLYRRLYVLRLRCLRFVARSLTKVRPVGSKTHRTVMQTLRMTTQLHTTIPAKKEEKSGALPVSLGSIASRFSPHTSDPPLHRCRADRESYPKYSCSQLQQT